MTKKVTLIIVVALIVIAIGYFELQRPKRIGTTGQEIEVSPILTLQSTTTNKEFTTTTASVPTTAVPVVKKTESADRSAIQRQKAALYERVKEFVSPGQYINTAPFKLADLAGKKVILIDFWTYSCINCQRTTPYLNAWYEKYKDQGLVIVGVHTPEFDFEKVYENVVKATQNAAVKYPVVQDNEYGTWGAYGNRFWPRKYLIDIDGFIVYDHIGEGDYAETEREIQRALQERKEAFGLSGEIATGTVTPGEMIPTNFFGIKSPEVYFGAGRNELANGVSRVEGTQTLTVPEDMVANKLYLEGVWDFGYEFTRNTNESAKLVYRYSAKNVYMVARSDAGVTISVTRDGVPLGAEAGGDVDANGKVFVRDDRLYELIKGTEYAEHTLQIEVEGPGLEIYTFTFG